MDCQIKTISAKMFAAMLLSLFAVLVSGYPLPKECRMLEDIKHQVDLLENATLDVNVFVEDLRDPHDLQCKIKTLCKAEKILRGHNDTKMIGVLRALTAYKEHHNKSCNAVTLENLADQKQLKNFLEDVGKCVQVLYHKCPTTQP